ncbi:hypothetical protein [Caballeronia sp. BR00000012568055]|uniref:hypothetical protein n=1 Tax=Caballeronia sp. BR00000012568055 TaxID=2918761 RepID=UPI0023F9A15C|nr:hypothetical protein [Caballeronia sp. BR00000012568055]
MSPVTQPAPVRQPVTKPTTPSSKNDPKRSAATPDAAKAEPVPHKRPPVRSDDN